MNEEGSRKVEAVEKSIKRNSKKRKKEEADTDALNDFEES